MILQPVELGLLEAVSVRLWIWGGGGHLGSDLVYDPDYIRVIQPREVAQSSNGTIVKVPAEVGLVHRAYRFVPAAYLCS